jgi:hypothetical protein
MSTKQTPSFESAQQAKYARVDEITRRAAELDPPITSDALQLLPAFQAAHNIPRPLDDSEWSRLQKRLLEQRAEAEQQAKIKVGKNAVDLGM